MQLCTSGINKWVDCLLMLFLSISFALFLDFQDKAAYMPNPEKHESTPPAALVKSSSDWCFLRHCQIDTTALTDFLKAAFPRSSNAFRYHLVPFFSPSEASYPFPIQRIWRVVPLQIGDRCG